MNNALQDGRSVTVAAPADVTSGDFIVISKLCGICVNTVKSGANVAITRPGTGAYTLPKATGETWAIGDKLYWDNTAKKFTKTSTSNVDVRAAAFSVTLTGDTTGAVIFDALI